MPDRRQDKTERQIKMAFFSLLERYPDKKVTIKALCDEADVSRSTFYDHFEDYDHFMDSLQLEIAQKLLDCTSFYHFDRNSEETIEKLLETVIQNKELFTMFFDNANSKARKIFKEELGEESIRKWQENSGICEEKGKIVFEYIMEGQFALLKYWLENHEILDLQDFKDTYNHLIYDGLLYFAYKN